jgi:uncharacterized protein
MRGSRAVVCYRCISVIVLIHSCIMTERHENFPNGLEALCLIVTLFFIEMVIAGTIESSGLFADINSDDVGGLITVAGNGVLFCALLAYKRIDHAGLFHPARHSVFATLGILSIPVLLLVPGLVVALGLLNVVLVNLFPTTPAEEEIFEQMLTGGVVAALFSCVIAPVLEEMLFRGIILRSFLRQYSRGKAILGSSALFGLAHLNVYQLATGFVIGVVAGWLYHRSRSLWPCIVLHAAYNSAVTFLAVRSASPGSDDWAVMGSLVALVTAGVAAFVLRRLLTPDPEPESKGRDIEP